MEDDNTPEQQELHYYRETANVQGFKSVWSIEGTEFNEPHPFVGHTIVRHQADGDAALIDVPILGPLWLDMWKWIAADHAIARSRRHRYIEGFHSEGDTTRPLILATGS
jgi:hypothetical protein